MDQLYFIILTFLSVVVDGRGRIHLGCYKKEEGVAEGPALDLWFDPRSPIARDSVDQCINACAYDSFRYAGVTKEQTNLACRCGSSYGRNGLGACDNCSRPHTDSFCGSTTSYSIYDTEFKVPSSVQQVMLLQRAENSLRISWVKPKATNGQLKGYLITAKPIFSYSHSSLQMSKWEVSDGKEENYLVGLQPGTQYNVSVSAVNSEGPSAPTSVTLWTKIGVPEIPQPPSVFRQDRHTMGITLVSANNTRGPISAYRIALIDDSRATFFNKDQLVTWNDSMNLGYNFYIAAEFSPENLPTKFYIGDGYWYGGYYNGHMPEGHWHPKLGVVSTMGGFMESSYSATSHEQHTAAYIDRSSSKVRDEVIGSDPKVVMGLWIAIGVSGFILMACLSAYVVLKIGLVPKRRRRSPTIPERNMENHQLTTRDSSLLSFPESSNGAYTHASFIHDEDPRLRVLEKLKEVSYVPKNILESPEEDEGRSTLVGNSSFGPVYLTAMKTTGGPVTLFSLPSLHNKSVGSVELGEKLYAEVEELIRVGSHENVVKFIGFFENAGSMYFPIEGEGIPLKELLLHWRNSETTPELLTSYNLLLCGMNIAEGMHHLHFSKVTHGELSAANVLVTDIRKPKITGFGFLSYNPLYEVRDFTRWAAQETFQNRCIKPCDLWSFGVLLWEIATLGGTPYYEIRSEDLSRRICRGTRPTQMESMGDGIYQLMLHTWQIDRDERPDFPRLSCSIHELLPHSKENVFMTSSFPPYIHEYEHRN